MVAIIFTAVSLVLETEMNGDLENRIAKKKKNLTFLKYCSLEFLNDAELTRLHRHCNPCKLHGAPGLHNPCHCCERFSISYSAPCAADPA